MIIRGKGHPNITARHKATIAFTSDKEITLRGDCFVAVACTWEATPAFLAKMRSSKKVLVEISCMGEHDTIIGSGHPNLTISSKDLVIRKSDWVDQRTLIIKADKAAKDLNPSLVAALQTGALVVAKVTPS